MIESIKNLNRKFDKSKWVRWKFSDLVENINEKVTPKDSGLKHYIGLEHLDSGSLKIRRYGETDSLIGDKLKIYKGDLIFAKRNAYLKRVAIAEIDAVASAHSMVLRPIAKNVLPELLPFFMMSEAFWERAIEISVGSLSPTINWSSLAKQEFLLPPKDQQAQIAELLWAMDDVIEKDISVKDILEKSYNVILNQFLIHGEFSDKGELVSSKCGLLDSRINSIVLKDCLIEKPSYGANAPSKNYIQNTPRYIRITDIDDKGELVDEEIVSIDSMSYSEYLLKQDDFLIARTGNTVGKTFLYDESYGDCVYAGYLIRFRVDALKLLPKFLFHFSKSLKYETFKMKTIKVGAQPNINAEEYQSMVIPYFSIEVQKRIVSRLELLVENGKLIESKISASRSLQKSLINQVF